MEMVTAFANWKKSLLYIFYIDIIFVFIVVVSDE